MITILTWLLAIMAIIIGALILFTVGGAIIGIAGGVLFMFLDIIIALLPFIIVMAIAKAIKKKKEKKEDENDEDSE